MESLMDTQELTNKLLTMLTYRRRARSAGEEAFIDRFIMPVKGIKSDCYGNLWVKVGDNPNVLFSCHTDSVHYSITINKDSVNANTLSDARFQTVQVDEHKTYIHAGDGEECLGADDAVGCLIMLEMIANNVEGLYVFHRDEEIGGRGSSYIASADEWRERLKPIKQAVAFDRAGCSEVITAQGTTCCSDTYARALSDLLNVNNRNSKQYAPSSYGVFTDTANYVGIIPECTNIGCGYYDEHTINECVVISEVMHLLKRCLEINWACLPIVRNPATDNGYPMQYGHTCESISELADTIYTMSKSDLEGFIAYVGITMDDVFDYYSYMISEPYSI